MSDILRRCPVDSGLAVMLVPTLATHVVVFQRGDGGSRGHGQKLFKRMFRLGSRKKVMYPAPATRPRSRGIVHWQLATSNKLQPKPTPKPNPNPTLTLPNPNPKLLIPKKRKTDRQITKRLNVDAILIFDAYWAWSPQSRSVAYSYELVLLNKHQISVTE